jgi:putative glutamine amidotransferase
MKIGFLTRTFTTDIKEKVSGVPLTYLNLIKNKHYPVIISNDIELNSKNKEILEKELKSLDGIILPGGDAINSVDLYVIDYCIKNNLPLLGVCLGMQEIAYYFNEKTLKRNNTDEHMCPKEDYVHSIKLKRKGYLSNLLNANQILVNSRHNYHISNNKHYTVEAKADKLIEAIKVKNTKYVLGVQFHPEIMCTYNENAKIIIEDFLKICSL